MLRTLACGRVCVCVWIRVCLWYVCVPESECVCGMCVCLNRSVCVCVPGVSSVCQNVRGTFKGAFSWAHAPSAQVARAPWPGCEVTQASEPMGCCLLLSSHLIASFGLAAGSGACDHMTLQPAGCLGLTPPMNKSAHVRARCKGHASAPLVPFPLSNKGRGVCSQAWVGLSCHPARHAWAKGTHGTSGAGGWPGQLAGVSWARELGPIVPVAGGKGIGGNHKALLMMLWKKHCQTLYRQFSLGTHVCWAE